MNEIKFSSNKRLYEEDLSVFQLPIRKPTEYFNYCDDVDNDHICDVFKASSEIITNPSIVLFHGGYWNPKHTKDHLSPLAGALSDNGYTVFLPEYRRVPKSPDLTFNDINSFLKKISAMPENQFRKYIFIGHSVGGHLTILASLFSSIINSAILLAPVTDMQETERLKLEDNAVREFLGCSAQERLDLDPRYIPLKCKSVVLIHGEEDTKVPIEHSKSYIQYAEKFGVNIDYIELQNIGHFELINPFNKNTFDLLLNKIKTFY